ncbi:MAG: hypothetical protein AAF191_03585 [Verrucomicrobiota bacterium]
MGLKYFHFVFIGLAVVILLGFGLWVMFAAPGDLVGVWGRIGGAFSSLLGLCFAGYGLWFYKKSSKIIT